MNYIPLYVFDLPHVNIKPWLIFRQYCCFYQTFSSHTFIQDRVTPDALTVFVRLGTVSEPVMLPELIVEIGKLGLLPATLSELIALLSPTHSFPLYQRSRIFAPGTTVKLSSGLVSVPYLLEYPMSRVSSRKGSLHIGAFKQLIHPGDLIAVVRSSQTKPA